MSNKHPRRDERSQTEPKKQQTNIERTNRKKTYRLAVHWDNVVELQMHRHIAGSEVAEAVQLLHEVQYLTPAK